MRLRRNRNSEAESPQMTPMIDVVFLLLVFFVMTAKPIEVIGRLDADQGSGGGSPYDGLTVNVDKLGFSIQGRRYNAVELESALSNVAERSTEQTIVVTCTPGSGHGKLITLLDLCAKLKLKNVAMAKR